MMGSEAIVRDVQVFDAGEVIETYNFSVADFETFFVAPIGMKVESAAVWVNNCGPGSFSENDVAFGLTKPNGEPGGLLKFSGNATPGTSAELSSSTYFFATGVERN